MEKTKKNDWVEIEYSGYSNNELFDSNIAEDLKKLNPEAKPNKTIVSIGNGMVVSGLDKALEEKEIGKEETVEFGPKEGFGERNRELIKTIPLKVFREKKVDPRPGMVFAIDDGLVKIITISGARVIVDFNNLLAGKRIKYKFKITKKVDNDEDKTKAFFESMIKFVPEFEVKEKVIVKGPKGLEGFYKTLDKKFKELVGKDLVFEETKEVKKEDGKKAEKKEEN